uniref:Uncharacterized protein n=1 Tax=Colobus angolensis palliatus TaxID=336983 RepID=A0A2K5KCF3_COLAP
MLFYLSSQPDWQVPFSGPVFFIIIFNDRAGFRMQALVSQAACRRSHYKLSAVYMVQGPLTHLMLVLGSGRAWAFSHSCFKTSDLLPCRNRWEVIEFLHYSNLHSHISLSVRKTFL